MYIYHVHGRRIVTVRISTTLHVAKRRGADRNAVRLKYYFIF